MHVVNNESVKIRQYWIKRDIFWKKKRPIINHLSIQCQTRVSRYRKGETNLDFTEARDNEWQWHQLGHMQVCTSLQTDNHAGTPPLCFLQVGCPSCRPTNSVKALKALFWRLSYTLQCTISKQHSRYTSCIRDDDSIQPSSKQTRVR